MTDYTSQGKTRPKDPVDLSSCRSHQSYYTCLSRSATASGTVIVQSFSPQLITSGASGYLRQELELLDEITKLRYEGELPDHIQGKFRNSLIREYQKWKGTEYVPPLTHPALKWSVQDPLPLLSVVTDAPWQIIIRKRSKRLRLRLQKLSLDLLQLNEVCLSNPQKSGNTTAPPIFNHTLNFILNGFAKLKVFAPFKCKPKL
jgi:hypothetical protein